jgi:hypothetical protein
MSDQIKQNLQRLIALFPQLRSVLPLLESAGIRYGLYSSAHVVAFSGHRVPSDIDIIISVTDLPKLMELFPQSRTEWSPNGIRVFVGEQDEIEFIASIQVYASGQYFPYVLNDSAYSHVKHCKLDEDLTISLLDPADTVLLKAMLQRGAEQGKHDVEDIEALIMNVELDLKYLHTRIQECRASDRVTSFLSDLGVLPTPAASLGIAAA